MSYNPNYLTEMCIRVALSGKTEQTRILYKGNNANKRTHLIRRDYREYCHKANVTEIPLLIELTPSKQVGSNQWTLKISKKYPEVTKAISGSVNKDIEQILTECHQQEFSRKDTASRIIQYITANYT